MKIDYSHLRKFPFFEQGRPKGLMVLFEEFVYLPVTSDNLQVVLNHQCKPALRPVSELTKVFLEKQNLDERVRIELEAYIQNTINYENLSNESKSILHENLFDVDHLIEEGLAIRYNKDNFQN